MSWYRRIKSLFTLEVTIFSYIVWSTINFIITKKHVNSLLFLNLLISVFFMQYINYKKENKWLAIGISSLATLPINFLLFKGGTLFTLNYLYLLFMIIYCYRLENNYINYYFSREMFRKSLSILVAVWIITIIFGHASGKSFFRFYIIYLTIGIIHLRQIRDFSYNVINKKSFMVDSIIAGFMFSLSIEGFYNLFFKALGLLKVAFDYIAEMLIKIIIYVLDKPYTILLNYFKKLLEGKKLPSIVGGEKKLPKKKFMKTIHYGERDIVWIKIAIEIILVIIIIIAVYKIIEKLFYSPFKQDDASVISEEKEKINLEKEGNKKGFFNRILDGIYFGKDPRKKIRHLYRTLEKISKDKEMFSEYMTATQLENSIKTNRNVQKNHLTYVTGKYNEAKFSTHEIQDEMAEKFKTSYTEIKKNI